MNNLLLNLYIKCQMLLDRENGQDLVEYVLLAGLISLGAVAGTRGLASGLNTAYVTISTKFVTFIS